MTKEQMDLAKRLMEKYNIKVTEDLAMIRTRCGTIMYW